MQPVTSIRTSSAWLRHNLRDGVMCTTYRRASASLQVRLENPIQTYFHVMQAARSRHVSRADLHPLVLRPKLRNRRGDFDAQITKPELSVLRPKPGSPPPPWFWGSTKKPTTGFEAKPEETVATSFEVKLEKTVTTGFEAKPVKTVWVVLRPYHSQTVDLGFEAQPRNPRS
jgi:hypothetical protein